MRRLPIYFMASSAIHSFLFFFQAEDGIRDWSVTGVQTCALPISRAAGSGDRKNGLTLARELRERHYNTAGELLGTALFTQFHSDLGAEFEELEELLRGISAEIGRASCRERV